jgi:hypothetical protein
MGVTVTFLEQREAVLECAPWRFSVLLLCTRICVSRCCVRVQVCGQMVLCDKFVCAVCCVCVLQELMMAKVYKLNVKVRGCSMLGTQLSDEMPGCTCLRVHCSHHRGERLSANTAVRVRAQPQQHAMTCPSH